MITRTIALILIAVLGAGCGPRTIPVVSSADVDDANERIRDRRVTMRMEDGTRMPCERAVVGLDTCTCVDARVGAVRRVPSSGVEFIKIGRPGRGALWGLLIGGGVGALLVGLSALEDPDEPDTTMGFALVPPFMGFVGLLFAPFVTCDLYVFGGKDDQPAGARWSGSGANDVNNEPIGNGITTPPN